MPQPPARRSRRFLSENSPTPEAASEGDEEGGMPPRQPRLAWQETWSSGGSNRPAEDSLLAVERTPVEAFLLEEDSSPEKAREIQVLLPDILGALQDTNTDMVLKALLVLRNVTAHVKMWKASGPALQLAEKLLPLFDHASSQVREHSICLFQAMVEAVPWQRKKKMKRTVHSSLLPLYFHMRDQSESVAKASGKALAVAAEFLRRKELKRFVQTEQTWRIGECLLQQDRGRVEEYLQQSQPYLQDPQTLLRLEAVRFIGLAARYCEDQSEEKLVEILRVLRSSQKDPEPMVHSLAAQTSLILMSRHTATSGRRFRLLWCC